MPVTPETSEPKKPILIVLHQERSISGRVGQLLTQKGFPLDVRRPALGQTLPSTMEQHSGAVVFGGPMSANDNNDFVRHEIDWLSIPLKENRPLLGICLGAQMLARQLGARVYGNEDGLVEIGWYPIEPSHHGRMLLDWPSMVYQFHNEGFDLPHGADLLATGDLYPNQAFRYGEQAYAVQFHAELTRMMMHRWVVRGATHLTRPGAQPSRLHLEGRMLYDHALKTWLNRLLDIIFDNEKSEALLAHKVMRRFKAINIP